MAEWLRRLTHKSKVRTAVSSNPLLDSLVAVRNSSPSQPEPCEGNLVATAGSCGGLMVKHLWPLLETSLSDFRRLATLNINTYCTYLHKTMVYQCLSLELSYLSLDGTVVVCLTASLRADGSSLGLVQLRAAKMFWRPADKTSK